ncbi:phosphate acyltransferase PlsX [Desulfuribacillus alkaliarsenatis]|uniref:Phosphate acyltransferase n=1 Tax=Desulfuribacillus alkaliarsenatis TaxID=766136 RepID=A0A1E5G5V5_9FIRM|nr:phosphate acyltransferase PlsX [Desulfuribacillus alkaliarsenatis]OEF98556.1 phosphate acyltransferase [Desulfuribacillus alkaliarsenatis]
MKIAIDAMGGDYAPAEIVYGVIESAKKHQDVLFALVGDENKIKEHINELPKNITIHHTDEVIEVDEEPVRAVKKKKNSSIVVAAKLVKEKQAQAMITAGNTGAFMAAGLLVIGRLPGVARPALAPVFPSKGGKGTMVLDVGANMDAKPEYLLQHAILGSIYMNKMLGIQSPRVGLVNIGSEAGKGNELSKAAYQLLEQASINFVGNIEARDVMADKCDVLVCDGFTGNILLKTAEGVASTIFGTLKSEIKKSLIAKIGGFILLPTFKTLKGKLDYHEYGGAPLLGLNGACIKSHGSSDRRAIMNAIEQTMTFINNNTLEEMTRELTNRSEVVE